VAGKAWHPREPAPAFVRDQHPPGALAAALGGWQRMLDEERDSVTITSLVMAELSLLGAPPAVLGEAARVIEDEVRHVEVCATVIEKLGGDGVARVARARDRLEGRGTRAERVARALCAGYVAGEALSAACFAAARRRAGEPLIHWAYTELLRDEARHGAFGADAAAWVMRGFGADARRALWPACVLEMETFEARAGGEDRPGAGAEPLFQACERLGMVPRAVVQEAIVAAIPRWVLPRLAELGVTAPVRGGLCGGPGSTGAGDGADAADDGAGPGLP
jgi:hypothetical protein